MDLDCRRAAGPDTVYLFVNSLSGYIVPRRAFADAAGFDTFFARASEFYAAERAAASARPHNRW